MVRHKSIHGMTTREIKRHNGCHAYTYKGNIQCHVIQQTNTIKIVILVQIYRNICAPIIILT